MQQPPGERGAAGEPTPVALRKQGTHNTGRGMYVKIKSLGGVLSGKLSALSKPNLARKYSLESSWRDLQDLHAFAPLKPQYFSKISSIFFGVFNIRNAKKFDFPDFDVIFADFHELCSDFDPIF